MRINKYIFHSAKFSPFAIFNLSCCQEQKDDISYSSLYPSKDKFFVRDQHNTRLSILYDSRTRNPRWVMEHLSSNSANKVVADRKKSKFFVESAIDVEAFRVMCDDGPLDVTFNR